MRKVRDETGNRYNRWTALEYVTKGHWLCRCDCGTEAVVCGSSLRSGHSKSCGCLNQEKRLARRQDKHPSWKDGTSVHSQGYIVQQMPDHPRNHNGYVYQHVLVAEKKLGRFLEKHEVVHHCNGDRADNNPDNLMVFNSQSDHVRHHYSNGDLNPFGWRL